MIVAVAVLVVLLALAGGLAGVLFHRSVHGLLAQRRARRVLVTLKSGEAFAGVLLASDHDCLILREAEALGYGRGHENVVIEGEALVLRADVAYIQLP